MGTLSPEGFEQVAERLILTESWSIMASEERRPKRSPGRLAFIGATWVAFAYSVYSIFGWGTQAPDPHRQRRDGAIPEHVKVEPAELAGTWVPDEATAARLGGMASRFSGGGASPRLVLTTSSFELSEVPYLGKDRAPQIFFASWRGNWNLYRQHDTWAIYLPHGPADARGLLYGERPHYRLGLLVGDPTVNEALWFVKR